MADIIREQGDGYQATPDDAIYAPKRGYVTVAHDYYPIRKYLSLAARACLTRIVRMTAGYQRPSALISLSYLQEEEALSRNGVIAALRELTGKGLISIAVTGKGRGAKNEITLRPQSDWQFPCLAINGALSEPITMNGNGAHSEPIAINGAHSEPITQKNGSFIAPITPINGALSEPPRARTYTEKKERERNREKESSSSEPQAASDTPPVKSKSAKSFPADSEPMRLAHYLRDAILAHKPDARLPKPDALNAWAGVMDLMLRVDGRAPPAIRAVIDWSTHDTGNGSWKGWQSVILSPGSLREKFDRLQIQAAERQPSNGNVSRPATRAPVKRTTTFADVPENLPPTNVIGPYWK